MSEDKKAVSKEKSPKSASPKKTLIFVGLIFILVLSVVSFVFIPVVGTSAGSEIKEPEFGKWGKTPITCTPGSYFARQIESYTRYAERNGQKVNDWIRSQIWYQAYNMTVVRTGIREELDNSGYIIPEEAVNKALLQYYMDGNGKFSQKLYQSVPESERINRRKIMEEDLAVQTYAEDLCGAVGNLYGLKSSSKEVDLIRTIGKIERSFYMAAFPIKNYPSDLVAAYGAENSAKFVKLNTSIVTASSKKDAENLLARINSTEITFEDAVAEYSTGSRGNKEGKITQTYAYQYASFISDDDVTVLSGLLPAELSPVMKIGENDEYGFFRINEAAVQPDFSADEMVSTVTAYMNSNDRGKIEDYFVSQARDFVLAAKKDGFTAACTERGIEAVEVPFFPLNYNNSSLFTQLPVSTVKELSDVQNNEDFFAQAFGIKGAEISEPIVTNSNVLVLTLKEERPVADIDGVDAQYADFCAQAANSQMMASYMENPQHTDSFFAAYLKYFPGE